MRRYILPAVDDVSKLGFVRMASSSSQHAADFLRRLQFLTAGRMLNLQTDNASEFAGTFAIGQHFATGCLTLGRSRRARNGSGLARLAHRG